MTKATQKTQATLTGPILVGVGSDAQCDHAVHVALELGKQLGVSVEFVHGVPEAPWHGLEAPVTHQAASTSRRMSQARSAVGGHLDSLPTGSTGGQQPLSERLKVLPGKPAQVLLERSADLGAGLLVLGPHQRRGFIDLGSTARSVLSHARCPVWVQFDAVRKIERVVAPVDLSDAGREALALAARLAREFGAKLTVVHCFVAPDFAYPTHPDPTMPAYVVDEQRRLAGENLQRFVAEQQLDDLPVDVRFEEADPTTYVLGMQQPGDLIVMGTHGHGGFAAAVLGSVTYAVLREASAPVVAVRQPEQGSGAA